MTSLMSPMLHSLLPLLLLLSIPNISHTVDVFCGDLTVYEQQRFGTNSVAISSQETVDLKQCLELCCGILNCDGVSFIGIISSRANEPNCLLIGCRGGGGAANCHLNPRVDYGDGVISVLLNRTHREAVNSSEVSSFPSDDAPTVIVPSAAFSPTAIAENATTEESSGASQSLAPVWAVGLAIVIAVVCVGLNLSLLSAYICYRRKQSRKHTANISTNKAPTLHAFNPTI